jgi:hypothetical protein
MFRAHAGELRFPYYTIQYLHQRARRVSHRLFCVRGAPRDCKLVQIFKGVIDE